MLGIFWSALSPLLTLLVMSLVFTRFFGRTTPHYTIYLFSGNLIISYFREATKGGMGCLLNNASIISKINVPKYMFLLSKNTSSFVNFLVTLCVYFAFCCFDKIKFGLHMLSLIYPVFCLLLLNIGVGMILSSFFVLFRDLQYLYDVFLTLLNYVSAVFYTLDGFSPAQQKVFLLNPVYVYIKYFRVVVIESSIPSVGYHLLCAFYAVLFLGIGRLTYKKLNHQFLYYI